MISDARCASKIKAFHDVKKYIVQVCLLVSIQVYNKQSSIKIRPASPLCQLGDKSMKTPSTRFLFWSWKNHELPPCSARMTKLWLGLYLQILVLDYSPLDLLFCTIFLFFCAWRFKFNLILRLALRSGSTKTLSI